MPDTLPRTIGTRGRLTVDFLEATRQAFEAADENHDYLIRTRRSGGWIIERYDLDGRYRGSLVCRFAGGQTGTAALVPTLGIEPRTY